MGAYCCWPIEISVPSPTSMRSFLPVTGFVEQAASTATNAATGRRLDAERIMSIPPAVDIRSWRRRIKDTFDNPGQHHLRIPQSRVGVRPRGISVPAMFSTIAIFHDRVRGRVGRPQERLDAIDRVVQVVIVHVTGVDAQFPADFRAQSCPVATQDMRKVIVLPPVFGGD